MNARQSKPNVVVILFDDLGFAQLGCFGAEMDTPNIDRLAAGGLSYSQFHVTAICSPTRASLLTGRNHHAVGCGFLVDLPLDLPGYSARPSMAAATMPRLLKDAGYSTIAAGKWHLTPTGERSPAGPFDTWPLGYGFENYYGFLQGDTNHWTPHLVQDNTYLDDAPARPENGYHFTEDIAAYAQRSIISRRQAAPDKPFFLYFSLGAMHAPHHVATEWVTPYEGRFDDGWEALRARTFDRQIELGVVPAGTTLSERPEWIPDWDGLSEDDRRLYARMQETYAGFLTHTDAQIGVVLDALDDQGILDDTIVILTSDNGASAEGGVQGTFNEMRFSSHLPETTERNLPFADDWGGFRSYSHYAWGWAWAGNTPFKLWKRYSWLGGTRTPLIVHWPSGIEAKGEVRNQFCHVADVMPTVLDAAGIDAPDVVDGVQQQRIDGVSLVETFDDAELASPRTRQYFEMLGSRSMYLDGWKATTDHVSEGVADEERLVTGSRDFDDDRWSLYDLRTDFAEAHDVAADHPETLALLQEAWGQEAEANNVLPMFDSLIGRLRHARPFTLRPAKRTRYVPAGGPVPDAGIAYLFGGARIEARGTAPPDASGVLCALGDWSGGWAMFVNNHRLHVAFNSGGDLCEVVGETEFPEGDFDVACALLPQADGGVDLLVFQGGDLVGRGHSDSPVPMAFQHGGTMMCLGYDRGFPVSESYAVPSPWTGTIDEVVIDVNPYEYVPDLDELLHRD